MVVLARELVTLCQPWVSGCTFVFLAVLLLVLAAVSFVCFLGRLSEGAPPSKVFPFQRHWEYLRAVYVVRVSQPLGAHNLLCISSILVGLGLTSLMVTLLVLLLLPCWASRLCVSMVRLWPRKLLNIG